MKVNDKIDNFLKTRRRAIYDLNNAVKGLYAMGVRFFKPNPESLPTIIAAQDLIPRFEKTFEDYEWQIVYKNGETLDQYGKEEHHFGDIELDRVKKARYISNFRIHTQNSEKRLIITLDIDDGTFDFWNCGSQKVRNALKKPIKGEKKLIIFKRKRQDVTASTQGGKISPTGERFTYTRYYIGFETKDKKRIVCCYPNGRMGIEK